MSLTTPPAHDSLLAVVIICACTCVIVNFITFQEGEVRVSIRTRERVIVGGDYPFGGGYYYALVCQYFVQLLQLFALQASRARPIAILAMNVSCDLCSLSHRPTLTTISVVFWRI